VFWHSYIESFQNVKGALILFLHRTSLPPPKKIKKNSFYTGVLQKKNYFKNGSARRKKLQNIAIDVHGGRGQKEILF
jgi:hypothetical protein